ncbi:hypothetical protein QQS21_000117 [Conoideocrella luteorostrata]|uniref:Aminoglycoside phosphotransferase domain-containing protein n=1 Tax=Conoideocrella luteorostrata TaxID=1105319 RepID=A0AAJ0CZM6_9HYPO|nr:hypothetical protein QQS21_000117 [Conoideocrella luteorostrata]
MSMFSDRDGRKFVTQMQDYVAQLRVIPPLQEEGGKICNSLGKAGRDPRVCCAEPIGTFDDEVAFSQYLRYPDDPSRRGHKITFTHADLNLRNILVDRVTRMDGIKGWQIVGIIDWELLSRVLRLH